MRIGSKKLIGSLVVLSVLPAWSTAAIESSTDANGSAELEAFGEYGDAMPPVDLRREVKLETDEVIGPAGGVWESNRLPWVINMHGIPGGLRNVLADMPPTEVSRLVNLGASSWNYGEMSFELVGEVDDASDSFAAPDGRNSVSFEKGLGHLGMAFTRCRAACLNGGSPEFDIKLSADGFWDERTLVWVAAHEFGHVLGMDHVADCQATRSIMCPFFNSTSPMWPQAYDLAIEGKLYGGQGATLIDNPSYLNVLVAGGPQAGDVVVALAGAGTRIANCGEARLNTNRIFAVWVLPASPGAPDCARNGDNISFYFPATHQFADLSLIWPGPWSLSSALRAASSSFVSRLFIPQLSNAN